MERSSDEFLCGQCRANFNSVTEFLLHKVQHVEMDKPGSCPLCSMAFSRQVSLREHLHRKHNIPGMKTSTKNGKRRGRPRKELAETQVGDAEIAPVKTESELVVGAASSEPAASDGSVSQQTMHIIIDKIGAADLNARELSNAVLQADGSVTFSSSDSVVQKSDAGDSGQLVEQAQPVRQPETSQSQPDTSRKLRRDDVNANSPQDSALGSRNTAPVENNEDLSSSQNDSDPDFLFVLLRTNMKGTSMNYIRQGFKCFHCEFRTSWRRALMKHMKRNHADNLAIHQCISVCKSEKLHNQQVMKMSEYTAGLTLHRRQLNRDRIRGVEKQDLPGYHPCSHCDKVFGRLRYLRKHQVTHKAEKKCLCADCGKAFKTKAYLAAHRQTHESKLYRCGQCDFASSINVLIHSHRQLHSRDSVLCDVCGAAYMDRATLRKHKRVHDQARPYPCAYPGCTWRFKTEVMGRAHFRGHTTSGRFACGLCHYVFRHKHHLQRHLGRVHGLDEETVYRTTSGKRNGAPGQQEGGVVDAGDAGEEVACEEDGVGKELEQVVQEDEQPLTDTVNLIVNSGLSSEQLQTVLESGEFVIASDEHDSAVNYEVANITMNITYNALVESEEMVAGGQTILIPHDAECSQIIFQQECETVGPTTSCARVET